MSLGACKPSVIGLKGIFAKVSLALSAFSAFSAPKLLLERGSAELGRVKNYSYICCLDRIPNEFV